MPRHSENKEQITHSVSSLLKRMRRTADALPGGRFLRHQAEAAERRALTLLRQKLDQAGHPSSREPESNSGTHEQSQPGATAVQRLQRLMERSLNLNPDQAEEELNQRLLDQLMPDEARILAALSDGGQIAICHVDATSRLGTHSERILSNVSRIGQEAGVILPHNVPHYIGHLLDLGLLETGPEDKNRGTEYEMIETQSLVRKRCEKIENEMSMKPRITRLTARLSPLGKNLWDTCQPGS